MYKTGVNKCKKINENKCHKETGVAVAGESVSHA